MVRPDNIYKVELKGESVMLNTSTFLFNMRSKLLTKLQRIYFEWSSLSKRYKNRLYYNITPDIRQSNKFVSHNYRHYIVNMKVVH